VRKVLFIFLCIGFVINSCSEEDLSEGNGLKSGQVLLKAYPSGSNKISIWVTSDKISIDWGDGIVDELDSNGVGRIYSHEYANKNLQKIIVTGKKLTEIVVVDNNVYELILGPCPELRSLQCQRNQLTALDVSGCTRLSSLHCYSNQLSASALNNLFDSLPAINGYASISCYNNPGYVDCDVTILSEKGWHL
jgi:Leucine-rich repeat (LRR) protein